MKLTFFLIAVFLVLLRLAYPQLELWHNGRGQGMMINKIGNNVIQGIWWSGKIRLSDDEQSIAEISPGGYLKFKQNDTTMKAESDLQGRISYSLYNGHEDLPLNDSGQRFIAGQIRKMIRFGFFGEERAERIYRKGGVSALLAELPQITGDRGPYLNRLFNADTFSTSQLTRLLQIVDSSNNSMEQENLLRRFSRNWLHDSVVARKWLSAVGAIRESYIKKGLLLNYIDTSLTADRFDSVLSIAMRFESPEDQREIYQRLAELPPLREHDSAFARPWLSAVGQIGPSYIKKALLLMYLQPDNNRANGMPVDQFDTVLAIVGRLESPEDQKEILEWLINVPPTTDPEWAALIRATGVNQQEYIKTDLLLKIASKMPRTDSLRAAFRLSAKSIQNDMDYGRVMRAVE